MVSTHTNAMMVALPTSRSFFARPEMATAPSMPTNTQMVTIMVPLTCSQNGRLGSAPVARFAMKMPVTRMPRTAMPTSNFCRKMMAVMATKMGTTFEMVMTAFTPVTSLMPRDTRNT